MTRPTGSASARTTSRPSAMAATRFSSSRSRSRKAAVAPSAFAPRQCPRHWRPEFPRDLRRKRCGHGGERGILLRLARRERQYARRRLCATADRVHHGRDIHRSFNSFQKCSHDRDTNGIEPQILSWIGPRDETADTEPEASPPANVVLPDIVETCVLVRQVSVGQVVNGAEFAPE